MTRKMKNSGIEWIGEIPEEWNIGKLKKYAYLKTGATPSTKNQEIFKGEFKWFTPGDFNESLILKNSFRHLNKDYVAENIVPIYPKNSVLIVGIGATIGKLGFTTEESSSNQQITAIMSKEDIDSKFLLYMMLASVDVIKQTALFTTLPILNNQTLGETLILNLPKKQQIKIANYLNHKCIKIDQIIEKQKQVIKKLKEYKQSIITEAVTKGLNPNVNMKDSGVEWIPEHWDINHIKYILKFNPGYNENLKENDEVSFAPMETLKNDKLEPVISTMDKVKGGYTYFANEDIIMAKVTPCFENGNIAIATNLKNGVGFGSSELYVFRCTKVNNRFIFYYLQNEIFRQRCISTMYGTGGLKRVSSNYVYNYKLALPNLNEQQEIANYLDEKCKSIDKSIAQKEKLIEKLTEYKKSLIYEYVTGKREVK